MKLSEIKTGEIFTIGETPTYPKLRTDYGYIDMRDEIKKECNSLPWELRLMTHEELVEKAPYEITLEEITSWINELLDI